jgi:hypothetical protein
MKRARGSCEWLRAIDLLVVINSFAGYINTTNTANLELITILGFEIKV